MTDFHKPLNVQLLLDRVLPGKHPVVVTALFGFLIVYALDEKIGDRWGLNRYTPAAAAGIAVISSMLFIAAYYIARRDEEFELLQNEIIVAERKSEVVVVPDTVQLRLGALRGCKNPIVVNTRPWIDHRLECLAGSLRAIVTASLSVDPTNPQTMRRWLDFDENAVAREIRSAAMQVAKRLGRGLMIESPDYFRSEVEDAVNSAFQSSLGVTCRISAVQVVDHHPIGTVKQ